MSDGKVPAMTPAAGGSALVLVLAGLTHPVTVPAGTAASSTITILTGVSCPAPKACTAVGYAYGRRTLVESWNGTSWRIVTAPTPKATSFLLGVSCASTSNCMAVGSTFDAKLGFLVPLAEAWNGRSWSIVPVPRPAGALAGALESVSCTAASDCIAAGSTNDNTGHPPRTLIEHWDGTRWLVEPSPNTSAQVNDLWAVSCAGASECTAVGDSGSPGPETTLILRLSGTTWTIVPSPAVPNAQSSLQALSCTAPATCAAGGFRYPNSGTVLGATLAERDQGGAWSVTPSPDPTGSVYDGFGGASCPAATFCMMAGSAQSGAITTLVERWTGKSWMISPTPNYPGSFSALGAVSCTSAANCMAVGNHGAGGERLPLAEHWNGTSWAIVPTPNP